MVKLKSYDRLIINKTVRDKLTQCFYKGITENKEICGILIGQVGIVDGMVVIPNISDGLLYKFDPITFNKELNKLDNEGKELLAIFHTHPPNSLDLSQIDIDNAKLNIVYVVVSSEVEADGEFPEVKIKGWTIAENKTEEVSIVQTGTAENGHSDRTAGIKIEVSTEGLQAFIGMIEAYTGYQRLRRENSRLQDMNECLQRDARDMQRVRSGETITLTNTPIPAHTIEGVGLGFADPDRIAEDEMAFEDELYRDGEIIGRTRRTRLNPPIRLDRQRGTKNHLHNYKLASKTPDGKNLYECQDNDCNAILTVHGSIDPNDDLSSDKKEVEKDGTDTTGKGTDKEIAPTIG